MILEQTDTGMELNRGHYLCLPVGFVNIVLVLNICLVRSSPHPLPPGGRVVEILPRYQAEKEHQHGERGLREGGKKGCLFVGKLRNRKWSLCKNTHYMTHTAPWSILWGQGVAIRARLYSFQV